MEPNRKITLEDIERVKVRVLEDHKPILDYPFGGPIIPFDSPDQVIVEKVENFDHIFTGTPDHIGTVEVTYGKIGDRIGPRALYGVKQDGGLVMYAN